MKIFTFLIWKHLKFEPLSSKNQLKTTMKNRSLFALVLILALASCFLPEGKVYAVIANPKPVHYVQPDGSSLTILLKGDEFVHWAVTTDGYTLLSNKQGAYEYAMLSPDGKMGFSGIQANDPAIRGQKEIDFLSTVSRGVFFIEYPD